MPAATDRFSTARALALLIPAGLLAGAYISQYGFGLYPCEMCWWQRYAHFAALVPALLAFAVKRAPARALVVLAALAIAVSGAIGGYHAGVEYGWWDGMTKCASGAGGSSLEDIMAAPFIRCDVAPWSLFGISLAGFNAILSLGGALLVLVLLNRKGRA